MEFKPVYLVDRLAQTDHSNPSFVNNKLNIINPMGTAGIVTLWSKPSVIWDSLKLRFPALFSEESPIVALSSLYGNGLPQMLANLAHNPQIQYLAVTGNDTPVVPSFSYLQHFLNGNIELQKQGKIKTWKVGNTSFSIDYQLKPELFKGLKVERFKQNDLESLVNFVTQKPNSNYSESDRIKIVLEEPEFTDFPSDKKDHNITAQTPLEAWMEVIHRIYRFGKNVQLQKGVRRALYNLDVTVQRPIFEPEEDLKKMGFDPQELRDYQRQILDGQIPNEETSYTYGHRLRTYWGGDTLKKIGEMIKEDDTNRHGFVSLWDTSKDLMLGESSPCFTDAYFVKTDGKLDMSAGFRTHNAASAYLTNLYGLIAIQQEVARYAESTPGELHVRSRWIGIDPENSKTPSIIQAVDKYRKTPINVNDPRGYFVIEARGRKIVAEHYAPDAKLLKRYAGETAMQIKDQLRNDSAILDPDHAMWIGYELAKAHLEVQGSLPEL